MDKQTHALPYIQLLSGNCKEGVSVNKPLPESKWNLVLQKCNFCYSNNKHFDWKYWQLNKPSNCDPCARTWLQQFS